MKTLKQFMSEASSTQWGTWNSPKWRRDEEEWDSNRYSGLKDRLDRDPVAKLGHEVARNPQSGTVDSIDDIDSKSEKEKNLWGQLSMKVDGRNNVYKDKLRLRTDMPPETHNRNYEKLSAPKQDYQFSGDVKGHELGHLGSKLIKSPNDDEDSQRIRDSAKSSPDSTIYRLSTSSLVDKSLGRNVNDYDEWKNYAGQVANKAKDIVKDDDEKAKAVLNDPNQMSKLKSTYWSK
jgi:hypothetical protein